MVGAYTCLMVRHNSLPDKNVASLPESVFDIPAIARKLHACDTDAAIEIRHYE